MTKKKLEAGIELEPIELDGLGLQNRNLAERMLHQIITSTTTYYSDCGNEEQRDWGNAAVKAYQGIEPQNELEAMLAAQIVSNHFAVMKCYQRAAIIEQPTEIKDMYLKHAAKLSRIYIEQVLAINKLRGKGHQKVTVEHIHIHSGGQAIVGNVNPKDGRGENKATEQPHTKHVTHAPEQTMPCPNKKRHKVPISRDAKR